MKIKYKCGEIGACTKEIDEERDFCCFHCPDNTKECCCPLLQDYPMAEKTVQECPESSLID